MVMGAGPIGLFMTQIAKAYGAKQIITVDALENRLVVARQLGATDAINCREGNFEEQVLRLSARKSMSCWKLWARKPSGHSSPPQSPRGTYRLNRTLRRRGL